MKARGRVMSVKLKEKSERIYKVYGKIGDKLYWTITSCSLSNAMKAVEWVWNELEMEVYAQEKG